MSLGSPTSHNTVTTGSTFSSRSGTFDLSSRLSSRTGSFDLAQRRDEILPTQCYVCQSKFSSTVHSVLSLCDCRVAACQQCAVNSMIMNDDFALDCMICGFKVDSSTNTGIIRNVSKVKDLTDKLLERAFRFCRVPVPSTKDPTLSQFYPLLAKFSKISGISPHLQEFLRGNDAGENAQKERRKLNVNYLKLQLARAEYMRTGPLKDEAMEPGNLNIPESTGLPLGPLQCLSLTRNVYLERLLALCDSDCFSGCSKEIESTCVTCKDPIQSGESILLSCDCDVLLCRGCAIRGFMSSKYTYRKGVCCPSCSKNSMISMSNVEKAKEEEMSIIDMMIRKYSPMGVTYSSKSIMDLRKLLEHVYSLGLSPRTKTRDEIHAMSFHQVELELSRIYVAIERKKSKHEKLIKKEKKADKKKNSVDEKEAEFDEAEMKGKKGGKKKGEKEAELVFDQVVSYDNKEDENYLYEESQRDQGFDLPIGPLRLLRFNTNPFVELYLANNLMSDSMDPHEREIADLVQKHRFNPFKPKFNTPCPRCTINPQNMDYVRTHLKTCHAISRKDEIEKVMKTVTPQSVDGSHHFPFPSFGGSMDGSVVSPPRPPVHGRGLVSDFSELSIRLSNMEQGLQA